MDMPVALCENMLRNGIFFIVAIIVSQSESVGRAINHFSISSHVPR